MQIGDEAMRDPVFVHPATGAGGHGVGDAKPVLLDACEQLLRPGRLGLVDHTLEDEVTDAERVPLAAVE